jgi:hypothetical protein
MSADTRNVTLSLPRTVISRAKHLAIDKGTSLSGLVAQVLTDEISHTRQYAKAKQGAASLFKTPFNLGTKGKKLPARDELHAR